MELGDKEEQRFRFAEFVLDRATGTLTGPDGEVRLRPQTFRLLEVLVVSAPKILSADELIDRSWGVDHVSVGAIRQTISELRQALGDSATTPRVVETVHRRGYRLIAEVEELADERAARGGPAVVAEPAVPAPPPSPPATVPTGGEAARVAAESKAIAAPRRWPLMSLVLALLLAVALWRGQLPEAPSGPSQDGVVVADIVNLTGDLGQQAMTTAIAEMLRDRLAIRGDLDVISPPADAAMGRLEAWAVHGSLATTGLESRQRAFMLCDHAAMLQKRGRLDDALGLYERAEAIFLQLGDRAGLVGLLNRKAHFLFKVGELESAAADLRRAHQLTSSPGLEDKRLVTLCLLAQVAAAMDRLEEAEAHLAAARALEPAPQDPRRFSLWLRAVADVYLAQEDLHQAAEYYAECLAFSSRVEDIAAASHARIGLARIARRRHQFEAAQGHALKAVEGFVDLSSVPEQLAARCEVAELALANGDPRAAVVTFQDVFSKASELSLAALGDRARAGLESAGVVGEAREVEGGTGRLAPG